MAGQDLEPRTYSASPVGVLFFGGGYTRMTGGVVLDASLPFTDVHATINGGSVGIGYTFALAGRQALLTAGLPYAWGTVSGNVQEQRASVYRSGLANAKFRFDLNLHGSPAMTLKEFAERKPTYIVAASLFVDAPTGQYSGQKLVNIGVNRFAFKPQIGASMPWKKFEGGLYVGVWFFTANPDFFPGGVTRTQDPMPTLQGYASYTFRRHLWLSVEANWYGQGAAHLNGGPAVQRLNNSRLGATLSVPVARSQSVKISYAGGVSARLGSNFNTLSVGWQYTRLPRTK
ncbi:MAG TPA: transporter [Candidatus Angelobacter sp.]